MTTNTETSRSRTRRAVPWLLGAFAALAFTCFEDVPVWLGQARLRDPNSITAHEPESALCSACWVAIGFLLVLWPIALL